MQQPGFYQTDYSLSVNPGAQYKSEYMSGYGGHQPGAAEEIGYGSIGTTRPRNQERADRMDPAKNASVVMVASDQGCVSQASPPKSEPKLQDLTRPCPAPVDTSQHGKMVVPAQAFVPNYMTQEHPAPAVFFQDPTSYQRDYQAPKQSDGYAKIDIGDGSGTGFAKTQSKLDMGGANDGDVYATSYQQQYTAPGSKIYQ